MIDNPYEAPQTFDAPNSQPSDAEVVRRDHIKTEASVKSIGILYYLGGIVILLTAFGSIVDAGHEAPSPLINYGIAALLFLLAVFQFITGAAVRKLKPWSRTGVGILSGIGLLAFPVGTLVNAYILFLVFGKKGKMVFSEPYKDIIAATPHVKYKRSKAILIILGILIAVIVLGIFGVFMAGKQ